MKLGHIGTKCDLRDPTIGFCTLDPKKDLQKI